MQDGGHIGLGANGNIVFLIAYTISFQKMYSFHTLHKDRHSHTQTQTHAHTCTLVSTPAHIRCSPKIKMNLRVRRYLSSACLHLSQQGQSTIIIRPSLGLHSVFAVAIACSQGLMPSLRRSPTPYT